MMTTRIVGTGAYVPEQIATNDDLARIVETNDEWIRSRTGIGERRIATTETNSYMAAQAAKQALDQAGIAPEDVDLILLATSSPDYCFPNGACEIQEQIGAVNAAGYDISAACTGFVFALNTAHAFIQAGIYRTALVVGADVLSKLLDWTDRGTCVLFGDGAGAVVVQAADRGVIGVKMHSDGTKGGVLTSKITCTMHTGTHCDAPRHVMEYEFDGRRARYTHEMPIDAYTGEAVVLKLDVEPWTLITDKHLDEACKKCGIDPASLKGKVLCLNTGMHRLFDDSKAYYHYSIGTGIDAGKWFVKHGVKCVAMDSQALDHPLHTAMGNNGMTRMNLLGATGKPITEEYKELFGEEAYAEFDKFEYIRIHGQAAYDEKFGELEDLGVWGTWEPCHKEMLGHGIVGVENLGGDLDKIKPGKVFNFFCFPLRWYMGDGAMSRCVAFIDEDDVDASVPDRTYKYGGTGYADESGHGDSGLEYMRKLFNRNK